MTKAISAVIATIMLLMISTSLIGVFYAFSSGMIGATTSTGTAQVSQITKQVSSCVRIDNMNGNQIYLRNCGAGVITNESLAVYVDNVKFNISMDTIQENGYGVANITTLPATVQGSHKLQITSGMGSDAQAYSSLPKKGTESNPGASCADIFSSGFLPSSGVYWISSTGTIFQAYCDMETDGGGWMLVLLNGPYSTPPKPNWNDVVNSNNIQGNINGGLTAFDQFLGVKYWNALGNNMRVEAGSSPASINHRATYTFSLDAGNNYALIMSNQNILIGGTAPGIYVSHNNRQLTTYDADHDSNSGNCATYYSNTAWWYSSCWSGSFWGGGDADGYKNNPYWRGSSSEFFSWGAIWIK